MCSTQVSPLLLPPSLLQRLLANLLPCPKPVSSEVPQAPMTSLSFGRQLLCFWPHSPPCYQNPANYTPSTGYRKLRLSFQALQSRPGNNTCSFAVSCSGAATNCFSEVGAKPDKGCASHSSSSTYFLLRAKGFTFTKYKPAQPSASSPSNQPLPQLPCEEAPFTTSSSCGLSKV